MTMTMIPPVGGDHKLFVPIIKERDGYRCTSNCGRTPPAKMLKVVRRVWFQPDSYDNLETVCQWCAREQDRD
jgi:hypothetical protein